MFRIVDNIESVTGERLAREIAMLPQWRQEVVMKYKFESGRRESALAFRLLQQMLSEYDATIDTAHLEFDIAEHGKPSLRNHAGIYFNLSHCKYAVACAVGSEPVGIDIECTGRYKQSLAEYCMSKEEMQWIAASPADATETDVRFTELWTRKEALLKLIGTGITDDVKNILHQYEDRVSFHTVRGCNFICTEAVYSDDGYGNPKLLQTK